jgi:hypothetical protein
MPLVNAAFFSGGIHETRLFLNEYGRLRPVLGTAPQVGAAIYEADLGASSTLP